MKKVFNITKTHGGKNIQDFLTKNQGYSSRSMRKISLELNGVSIKSIKKRLVTGDVLAVEEAEKGSNLEAKYLPLDIVYEDADLLVLNKPPYLLVHPTKKHAEMTLAQGILYYFQHKGLNIIPRFYNRLDMNTSGIIIVAKNGYSQSFLQKNEVRKYYQAIVEGICQEKEFIVEKNIACKEGEIKRFVSETEGQYAKTAFKVLKENKNFEITLLEAELFTGRTHQIRVHLASVGHPIIGDELYGKKNAVYKRQLLHSYKTSLIHPTTKKEMLFEIELPTDMNIFKFF